MYITTIIEKDHSLRNADLTYAVADLKYLRRADVANDRRFKRICLDDVQMESREESVELIDPGPPTAFTVSDTRRNTGKIGADHQGPTHMTQSTRPDPHTVIPNSNYNIDQHISRWDKSHAGMLSHQIESIGRKLEQARQ